MEWNDGLKELNIKMLMAVLGNPANTRRFSAGNDGKFEQQTNAARQSNLMPMGEGCYLPTNKKFDGNFGTAA